MTLVICVFREADIYAQDVRGFTPMMNAIAYGHKEVVEVFLNEGYPVNTEVKQGKMLFEWAIELEHLSLIKVLYLQISLNTFFLNSKN